jgi:hypothetical protein
MRIVVIGLACVAIVLTSHQLHCLFHAVVQHTAIVDQLKPKFVQFIPPFLVIILDCTIHGEVDAAQTIRDVCDAASIAQAIGIRLHCTIL